MSTLTRGLTAAITALVLACPVIVFSGAAEAGPPAPSAAPPEVPSGFQDLVAIGNLSEPVAVAFAPDGTAFVALKTGVIKSFDYDAGTGQFEPFATHTDFANLDVNVNNFHDRGVTGIAVHPQFGTAGNNYLYVNYAYNRDPRDNPAVVPKWGQPGQQYDDCPHPASMGPPAVAGCVIVTRVSRLAAVRGADGWVMTGNEQPLVEDACMQFGSHASGDVAFGPDGFLYASAGDGASFDTEDFGQGGNPCADPVDEGGSLRSQDFRTSSDPLSLSGSVYRINPSNGMAPDGTSNNSARLVAYGQRNPWRLTFRPGTSELWSGDVGGSLWEEINRLDMAAFSAPENRGWPCYEGQFGGVQRQPGWDALDKPICENLYAAEAATPGTVKAPYFSYRTRGGGTLTPGENCQQGTSSISGVAFVPSTSTYPAQYRGSLFFNDYARGCVWRLGKLPNGDPDPNSIIPFVEAAETPVAVEIGPAGDLFYVDFGIGEGGFPVPGEGAIHRIVYTPENQAPVAALTADPTSGPAPLTVNFSAAGSTDGDGDALTYAWDLDGDGQFDDATGVTASRTYGTPGSVTVRVRVSDGRGGTDTEQVVISPGNSPPNLTSVSPAPTVTWAVGDTVNFAATATDAQQTLTDAAYTWSLSIGHCPAVCHTHPLQSWTGTRSGSFTTPDHEYPSTLLLSVTVTDDQGLTDTENITLTAKSVDMTFASNPTGAALTVAGADVSAPHQQTFIQGSGFNVTAPATRQVGGETYTFSSWSDGGALSHAVVAPTSATTLTANYVVHAPVAAITTTPSPPTGPAPFAVGFSAEGSSDPNGHALTFDWDLDDDGAFDDATGVTASRSYPVGDHVVRVRATDSVGCL